VLNNIYYVYAYLDPRKIGLSCDSFCFDFEPFYIGYGSKNRYRSHLLAVQQGKAKKVSLKSNKIKSLLSYGIEPVIIKIAENLSKQEAIEIEKLLISKIGTILDVASLPRGCLTNAAPGGHGGSFHASEEFKKKTSERMKNRIVSEETKIKISIAKTGSKHTNESKEKIKKSVTEMLKDPEKREKISKANKGRKLQGEHLAQHNERLTKMNKDPSKIQKALETRSWYTGHSGETLSKISNSVSEYYANNKIIWVHKDDESKRILETVLDEHLLLGWKRGRGKLPRS
jgi:hypothetical protein